MASQYSLIVFGSDGVPSGGWQVPFAPRDGFGSGLLPARTAPLRAMPLGYALNPKRAFRRQFYATSGGPGWGDFRITSALVAAMPGFSKGVFGKGGGGAQLALGAPPSGRFGVRTDLGELAAGRVKGV